MASTKEKTTPRYTIEIDEEGFPIFSGYRVDDPELLHSLFQNLKRADPTDLRSSLVTYCDNELCFVDAFSAPLVAQSVLSDNSGATFPLRFPEQSIIGNASTSNISSCTLGTSCSFSMICNNIGIRPNTLECNWLSRVLKFS